MSHWLQILFAVLQYWIVSITTVFLNKILLSTIDVTSSLPLTTTWVQTLLSALLFSIIHVSTYLWNHSFSLFPFKRRIHYDKIQASPEMPPTDERVSSSSLDSWKQKLNSFLTGAITLFPLSVAFLLMLLFTNLCLREVHITYYQIARSLGLPMIPLLSFILFKEKTHWSIVLSCLLIVSGYIYGVENATDLSVRGVLFGILSSVFGSLYTIYLKVYQEKYAKSTTEMLLFLHLDTSAILPLGMLLLREPVLSLLDAPRPSLLCLLLLCSGLLGVFVSYSTYLQIQYTSSLTHNVSGVVKNCIQTILGSMLFHASLSLKTVVSTVIISFGSLLYLLLKIRLKKQSLPAPKTLSEPSDELTIVVK